MLEPVAQAGEVRPMGIGLRTAVLAAASATRSRVPAGVALTFDDGPVAGTTDTVLDALAGLGVHATFFCVGRNAVRHPALVRRIVEEGHAIGSHSFSHAPDRTQSPRQLVRDYVAGRHAVEDAVGAEVLLFRPPYGRLRPASLAVMRSLRSWTWTIDPVDWAADASPAGLSAALEPVGDGDVVLFHDWVEPAAPQSWDRSATVTAVGRLVERLQFEGLPLVTLARTDSAGS